MANKKISDLTNMSGAATIDRAADFLEVTDTNASVSYKATPNFILGITGNPVGHTDTQTLSNKTLGITNTVTLTDSLFTLQDNLDNTKQAQFQLSGITTGTTRTYTMPNASVTLASLTGTETLTNKTLTAPVINNGSITGTTITTDAIVGQSASTTGTVYGVSVTVGAVSIPAGLTVTTTSLLTGAVTASSTVGTVGQLSVQTATAPPAAGANTAGIKLSSTANLGIYFGSGAPTFSAAQGSIYLRTDGSSTSTRLYVNTTGSTTWTNFTSAA